MFHFVSLRPLQEYAIHITFATYLNIQPCPLIPIMKVITRTPSSFKYWAEILHLLSACLENRKLISMTKPNSAQLCQVISHCRWLLRAYHCANPYTNLYHPLVSHNLKGTLTTYSHRSIQNRLCEIRFFFSHVFFPLFIASRINAADLHFFPFFLFDEVYCWLSRA